MSKQRSHTVPSTKQISSYSWNIQTFGYIKFVIFNKEFVCSQPTCSYRPQGDISLLQCAVLRFLRCAFGMTNTWMFISNVCEISQKSCCPLRSLLLSVVEMTVFCAVCHIERTWDISKITVLIFCFCVFPKFLIQRTTPEHWVRESFVIGIPF